ncbi:hypothetical protein VOLCADRAFT_92499 [Volvox carteri f. nagariensis]|uniref:Uncharacterized protein n=1 Tax=Volvox carteri f. nagariensis TaxID=3068 RepID=D8TZT7_VOLCA|nr:uncharacterized protein VOLCADRAFT_92499 [Volvox carteri f. nagariensis]EFJ47072.1 hypothetical protein VOLCADRAFT_92499 [Volvox carteri f. nagariensis]|eukprot:XP_002951967.1 hypothetical protein VOLCADRAFT_92499 [Volvox carteri f. nagariensis]
MSKQHDVNDDLIRFFGYNVEDDAQCLEGDFEAGINNHNASRETVNWDIGFFARDQHVKLKPGPFLEFVRHVGTLMLDVQKFRDARDAGNLHAYAVPEGLMYGNLGIKKLDEYRATKHPHVIPF